MSTSEAKIHLSREIMLSALRGTLSRVEKTRQAAQRKLQALEVQEIDEFVSQEALVFAVEGIYTPEIGSESKAKIKQGLLDGFCTSSFKVGPTTVGNSISEIAQLDWLESWPQIFDVLIKHSNEGSESARLRSWHVLTFVILRLTKAQVEDAGPAILREIYRQFEDPESSVVIRKQTIEIFSLMMFLHIKSYEQHEMVYQHFMPPIAMFCAKFPQSLELANSVTNDAGLKNTIVGTIRQLVKECPKCIITFLPKILPVTWEILMHGAKIHRERAFNMGKEKIPTDLVLAISNLIMAIMEATDKPWYSHVPRCNLQDYQWFHLQDSVPLELIRHLIIFVEITDKQIDSWKQNLSGFINEDRYICRGPTSVRLTAQKTLLKLVQRQERVAVNELCDVILKRIEAGDAMRNSISESGERQNWWKLHEASIQVFGIMKDFIIDKEKAGTLSFDIAGFLQNVVLAQLDDSEIDPLLIGRCLYVGGLYAEQMPEGLKSKFVESTINGLKTKAVYTTTLAAKAASLWLRAASSEENIIGSYLPALFQGLFNLGNQFMRVEDLTIVLESFAALASFNKAFTVSVESSIYGLTFAAFTHFPSKNEVRKICKAVFSELSQNPECIESLIMRLVPTLVCMLIVTAPKDQRNDQVHNDTFDILNDLVQHSPQPLSKLLIESAFPASRRIILGSFDYGTLLRGSRVIRTLLSVAAQQVLDYKDSDGKTGSQCILDIAAHLFTSQSSPSFSKVLKQDELVNEHMDGVASDIVTLLLKNHTLQEDINPLMEGVLSRIDKTLANSYRWDYEIQTLLMVCVNTMNTNFVAVFRFLSTPRELGKRSALAIVITEFCRQLEKFNCENRKLVTRALCKILEHGMIHQDSQLHNITFEETGTGNVTTRIPVLIKISKILSGEMSRQSEDCNSVKKKAKN